MGAPCRQAWQLRARFVGSGAVPGGDATSLRQVDVRLSAQGALGAICKLCDVKGRRSLARRLPAPVGARRAWGDHPAGLVLPDDRRHMRGAIMANPCHAEPASVSPAGWIRENDLAGDADLRLRLAPFAARCLHGRPQGARLALAAPGPAETSMDQGLHRCAPRRRRIRRIAWAALPGDTTPVLYGGAGMAPGLERDRVRPLGGRQRGDLG